MTNPNMDNMMDKQHPNNPNLSEALELIRQAVEGETEDRMFYDYLIQNANSEDDKEIIRGIRDNEINHAKMFRQLYYEHTGKVIGPDPNINFEPPRTYCEGLKRALIGETNAVKKYRKILFAMNDRRHINMLTEIITDELRHGILYSFLIHSNDCKY
jgi:rubrerythrin